MTSVVVCGVFIVDANVDQSDPAATSLLLDQLHVAQAPSFDSGLPSVLIK